jgi:hypothetical protein
MSKEQYLSNKYKKWDNFKVRCACLCSFRPGRSGVLASYIHPAMPPLVSTD